MLDYAALSALAAVIREGSFERAAQTLFVTPSAVSQRIRSLEERVGSALVIRGQPCRATDTGRRLCQHVDRVRLLEQELQSALPALAPEGLTRVALPIAVNADSLATWFAPAVAAYAADAPVLVELLVDDQDHTAAWLRSGAVLAAVTGTARPRRASTVGRWGPCATSRLRARNTWRVTSAAVSERGAWLRRQAWSSTRKTICRRVGCGAFAIGKSNSLGMPCHLPMPLSQRPWLVWGGVFIRRS